jgi:hypothetical protein
VADKRGLASKAASEAADEVTTASTFLADAVRAYVSAWDGFRAARNVLEGQEEIRQAADDLLDGLWRPELEPFVVSAGPPLTTAPRVTVVGMACYVLAETLQRSGNCYPPRCKEARDRLAQPQERELPWRSAPTDEARALRGVAARGAHRNTHPSTRDFCTDQG